MLQEGEMNGVHAAVAAVAPASSDGFAAPGMLMGNRSGLKPADFTRSQGLQIFNSKMDGALLNWGWGRPAMRSPCISLYLVFNNGNNCISIVLFLVFKIQYCCTGMVALEVMNEATLYRY